MRTLQFINENSKRKSNSLDRDEWHWSCMLNDDLNSLKVGEILRVCLMRKKNNSDGEIKRDELFRDFFRVRSVKPAGWFDKGNVELEDRHGGLYHLHETDEEAKAKAKASKEVQKYLPPDLRLPAHMKWRIAPVVAKGLSNDFLKRVAGENYSWIDYRDDGSIFLVFTSYGEDYAQLADDMKNSAYLGYCPYIPVRLQEFRAEQSRKKYEAEQDKLKQQANAAARDLVDDIFSQHT